MPDAQRQICGSIVSAVVVGRDAAKILHALSSAGVTHLQCAQDVSVAWRHLEESRGELVILCGDVPHADAMHFVKQAKAGFPRTSVVVVSEVPCVDWAVRFIRAGAYDYISGPLSPEVLRRLVAGIDAESVHETVGDQQYFCPQCHSGVPIVGRSPATVRFLETLRMVAQSRCNPVLILGETGTGKELAARAVHMWRYGDMDRFVAVNCATLTANLLESELFGHVRGAFTGADRDKTGLLEIAGDGSIFLDEISEMPLELQAKLLRVLQEKTYRKVGGTRDITCNATVIASSNRELLRESSEGRFRRDLYYRLAVFPLRISALSSPQRIDDVPLLADYFIQHARAVSGAGPLRLGQAARLRLMQHRWPGNIRELRNVIERATMIEPSEEVTPASLIFDEHDSIEAPAAMQFSVPASPFAHDAGKASFSRDPQGSAKNSAPDNAPATQMPPVSLASIAPAPQSIVPAGALAAPQAEIPAPAALQAPQSTSPTAFEPIPLANFSLEAAEREFILRALKETGWQRTRAAVLLGITRGTLHAKLKRYDIKIPDDVKNDSAPTTAE